MHLRYSILLLLLFLSSALSGYGQNRMNPDSLLQRAQELAYEQSYDKALQLSDSILDAYPEYTDARILKTRIWAWQKRFNAADSLVQAILTANPSHSGALLLATDISYWRKSYQQALEYLRRMKPEDKQSYEAVLRKMRILAAQGESDSLQYLADSLKSIYPEKNELEKYLRKSRLAEKRNLAGFRYTFGFFEKPYVRRWHLFDWEYRRKTTAGPLTLKIVQGDLVLPGEVLGRNAAWQYQADFYPEFSQKLYGYLSYGYSANELFPEHRAGVELYRNVGEKWELSAGGRFMNFTTLNNPIWIFTGSVSAYAANWLFTLRPFISPKAGTYEQSWNITARYYYSGSSYLHLLAGTGVSPDVIGNLGAADELLQLNTQKLQLHWVHNWSPRIYSDLYGVFRWEEYNPETHRNHIQAGMAIFLRF